MEKERISEKDIDELTKQQANSSMNYHSDDYLL